jgi:hypothetical protein
MSQTAERPPSPIKTLIIGDREYYLLASSCSNCGELHFVILRYSGISFARYILPSHFSADDFDSFVKLLDEELILSAPDLMGEFDDLLLERNSHLGISADDSLEFRLLEYSRLRVISLQKQGLFDALVRREEPRTEMERAVRTAFELGCAAAEVRVLHHYAAYVFEGMAHAEWREEGLPKAREERLRQGRRTRAAILKAADDLYAKEAGLIRNDTETTRRILKLGLPELQKSNGTQLGVDAITRHLRDARRCTPACTKSKSAA